MRIVYMGTPDFAVPALEKLYREGYEIPFVVTQPDAVRDRGKKVKFSPVKEKALELGLRVEQPQKLRKDQEFLRLLKDTAPDLIAVAAYGQILPKEVLEIPVMGCVNIHGSLLPRFRGAAPVQRAIMEGDRETGITIMYMAEGIDTGDMLAKRSTPVDHKTGQQLHDELARATYAPMISKKEGHIDFSQSPDRIERSVRAFDPWPGTYAYLGEKMMKIWQAEDREDPTDAAPGTILAVGGDGIDVAAGGGVLRVTQIQMPGKKRVAVKEYLKGNSIEIGTVLR